MATVAAFCQASQLFSIAYESAHRAFLGPPSGALRPFAFHRAIVPYPPGRGARDQFSITGSSPHNSV